MSKYNVAGKTAAVTASHHRNEAHFQPRESANSENILRDPNDRKEVKLNPLLYGRPVEEVDPFIFEDTFCLVSKKYRKHYIYRFSASKSLFIFGPLNPIRKFATCIVSNLLFDLFIILAITCNCVTMALNTNFEIGVTGKMYKNERIDDTVRYFEFAYLAIYTVEMMVKVIARGFVINKFSYLRNRWNILDCLVVICGYITVILTETRNKNEGELDLDILRTFRVLRAVKTMSILPGMRTMINSLLSSVVHILEVMLLTLFCLMIFALLGCELFKGKLRQNCVLIKNGPAHLTMISHGDRNQTELGPIGPTDPDVFKLWNEWIHDSKNWYMRPNEFPKNELMPCSNDSRQCPTGYVCLGNIGKNYDDHWTNFDDIGSSILTTFQLITLDYWERPYELLISVSTPYHVLFFIVVIFFGSYYLLNLMLAVVSTSYVDEIKETELAPLSKHQKLSLHRHSSTFSFHDPGRLNLTIMTEYRKRTPSEREMIAQHIRNMANPQFEPLNTGQKDVQNLQLAIKALMGRRASLHSATAAIGQISSKSQVTSPAADPALEPMIQLKMLHPPTPVSVIESQDISSKKSTQVKSGMSLKNMKDHSRSKASGDTAKVAKKRGKCCVNFWYKMKTTLTPLVDSWIFEMTITLIIIVNTTMMASEHYRQPKWLDQVLLVGNHVFTGIFALEALLKICALQKDYFKSKWNLFDLSIVVVSIVDSATEQYFRVGIGGINRVFRLLRVFKLAQSWITMKVLLNIIVSTFGALGNLIMVLLLTLHIFAVLGLQYIGEYYTKKAFGADQDLNEFPRWNFQHFGYAFMIVFRVICGEWIEPLWDCLKAVDKANAEYKCFMIFIPILIVGNFIVLNLFLALLLISFDTEEIHAQQEKELEATRKSDSVKGLVGMLLRKKKTRGKISSLTVTVSDSNSDIPAVPSETQNPKEPNNRFKKTATKVIAMNRKAVAQKMIEKTALKQKQAMASVQKSGPQKTKMQMLLAQRHSSFGLAHMESTSTLENSRNQLPEACVPKKCWSLNCCCFNCLRKGQWRRWQKGRSLAIRIVSHPVFEYFILALIFASSISLCFEDIYLEKNPRLEVALFYINMAFTIIFVFEMLLRWYAHGLWVYFTTSWTILDFIIVVISLTSFKFDAQHMHAKRQGSATGGKKAAPLAALKALRTLRALRPLRVISRLLSWFPVFAIVINALIYAIPSIFNVLLVCLLFWLVFAIMGVQFFKGKFHKCVDNEKGTVLSHEIVRTKEECCNNTENWSWINQHPNFDNVVQGYMTLFQVATFEGWMEAMQAAVDSTDEDQQPRRDNAMYVYCFFVCFIVFGAFYTFNLFIGVIIDNFNRLKKKYEGNLLEVLLTPSQRKYYYAMKKLGRKKPRKIIKRPTNIFLSLFYDIAMSRRFEIAIFIMIFFNLFIMGFEYHNQRKIYVHVLSGSSAFFTTIYCLEAIVKMVGLRQYYFTIPWNLFDFFLLIASCVDVGMGEMADNFPIAPNLLRIIRVFRIGRVLRLIKAAKGIRKLLFALVVSLPALFNIGALLFLITFIYAILGMSLFGGIAHSDAIDKVFNFDTFGRSCMMLLRLMTAAGWNDVLFAMTKEDPVCGTYRKLKCGEPGEGPCADLTAATLFMVTYLIVSYLIVINMYIAIILENYSDASEEEEVGIVEDDLEMFYVKWSRYDPEATQFISFDHLSDFLASLDTPLGVSKPNIVAIVAFNLPISRGNKIHCVDIIHALVKHVLGHIDDSDEFRKLQDQIEHKFRDQFPTRKLLDIISSTRIWKMQHNAAVVIQRAWRAYRNRKYEKIEHKTSTILTSITTARASHHHHDMLHNMGKFLHLGHHHHHHHHHNAGDKASVVKI